MEKQVKRLSSLQRYNAKISLDRLRRTRFYNYSTMLYSHTLYLLLSHTLCVSVCLFVSSLLSLSFIYVVLHSRVVGYNRYIIGRIAWSREFSASTVFFPVVVSCFGRDISSIHARASASPITSLFYMPPSIILSFYPTYMFTYALFTDFHRSS